MGDQHHGYHEGEVIALVTIVGITLVTIIDITLVEVELTPWLP